MKSNKQIQYRKMITRKNFCLYLFPPIGLICFWSIISFFNINNPILGMFILTLFIFLGEYLFKKINVCPWCKNHFFIIKKNGERSFEFNIFTQTKCINCGKPDDEA